MTLFASTKRNIDTGRELCLCRLEIDDPIWAKVMMISDAVRVTDRAATSASMKPILRVAARRSLDLASV